jgi:hypothetical protein
MADEIGSVCEIFIAEVPGHIAEIKNLLATGQFTHAKGLSHGIIPSFTSVWLAVWL